MNASEWPARCIRLAVEHSLVTLEKKATDRVTPFSSVFSTHAKRVGEMFLARNGTDYGFSVVAYH